MQAKVLILFFLTAFGAGQTRVIGHVATDVAHFESTLWAANAAATSGSLSVIGYDDRGIEVDRVSGQVIPEGGLFIGEVADLFSSVPSYLVIQSDDAIDVSMGFTAKAQQGTTAYVHETTQAEKDWRVFVGNWNVAFDGLALLNLSDEAASVAVLQIDERGEVVDETALQVDRTSKEKVVLGDHFDAVPRTCFHISATQPLYVVALSGTLPGVSPAALWANPAVAFSPEPAEPTSLTYPIVDTDQHDCYDAAAAMAAPQAGSPFFGQDAQYEGYQPSYVDHGDGTVTDQVTGLMWQQDPGAKKTRDQAYADLETFDLAGYRDWRLPTIKELYSLIQFSGRDPSGPNPDPSRLVPFIDTDFFHFQYGDESAGERLIDSQFLSATDYVSTTMGGNATTFGVNFADGRIKGYPSGPMPGQLEGKTFFVLYVRGNADYGKNDFHDNGDGTITDRATGLMWAQDDSGDGRETGPRSGMTWEEALAWVAQRNAENHLGHSDWRLPNAKELQSIVDYTRSPDTTQSAAIDPVFNITQITNEMGQTDDPWFWTSTTHVRYGGDGPSAAYVCFGRALGFMQGTWMDVHGAGAQRSDLKDDDVTGLVYVSDGYYLGMSPQGDAIRSKNYVRCVRDATGP